MCDTGTPYMKVSGINMADPSNFHIRQLYDQWEEQNGNEIDIAILRDAGKDYIVYHAYDAGHDGRPTLRIAPLGWTEDNWPSAFV